MVFFAMRGGSEFADTQTRLCLSEFITTTANKPDCEPIIAGITGTFNDANMRL